MNAIRKKLDSHETGVKWISAETADMLKIYTAAKNSIISKIARNSQRSRDPLAGKYLIALNETLMKEYAELESQLRAWGGGNIPYIAQSYYLMALADLDANGQTLVHGFAKERVKQMTDDYFRHIAGATRNMLDQDIRYLRNMSAQVFRAASISGKTRAEVSREMLSKILDLPGFKFIDKAGRRWNTRSYFDMLGRTVLMNAGRETYVNTCADNGKDVVRVTLGADSCPVCDKYENKLLSLSGKTEGLPTLDSAIAEGLFHPNCVHSVVAVSGYGQKTEVKAETNKPASQFDSALEEVRKIKPEYEKAEKDYSNSLANIRNIKQKLWDTASAKENTAEIESELAKAQADSAILKTIFENIEKLFSKKNSKAIALANKEAEAIFTAGNGISWPAGAEATFYTGRKSTQIGKGLYRKTLDAEAAKLCNDMLKTLSDEAKKLGMTPLRGVYSGLKLGTVASMGDGILFIGEGTFNTWGKARFKEAPKTWKLGDNLANRPKYSYDYFETGKEKIESALWHEFSHHIHQMKGAANMADRKSPHMERILDNEFAKNKKKNSATNHAENKNSHEWFAENYALAKMKKSYLIDPDILTILKPLL